MSGRTSKLLRRFCAAAPKSKPYRDVKRMYTRLPVAQKTRFRRMTLSLL